MKIITLNPGEYSEWLFPSSASEEQMDILSSAESHCISGQLLCLHKILWNPSTLLATHNI